MALLQLLLTQPAMQQHEATRQGLAPTAEQQSSCAAGGVHQQQQPSQRQHVARPSRLSAALMPPAVLVPVPAGGISPPLSPPSAASQATRQVGLPKSLSVDGLCMLDKQEGSMQAAPKVPPKVLAPPAKTPSMPPPSSPPTVSPKGAAAANNGPVGPQAKAATGAAAPSSGHAPAAALSSSESDASSSVEDENYEEWVWDTAIPWYCKPRAMASIVLLLASGCLVLAGLVLQVVFRDPEGLITQYEGVYPWLYFFAAFPPLALALRWLCWRLYAVSVDRPAQQPPGTGAPAGRLAHAQCSYADVSWTSPHHAGC